MLIPKLKLRAILKMVFQMTNQRNVSRKNSVKSITYMIVKVNAA